MILAHLCHQFPVLSVDSRYGPNVLAVLQGLEELAVPQHEHVLIGHEHLEGIHPFLPHQLLHLSSYLRGGEQLVNGTDTKNYFSKRLGWRMGLIPE